MRRNASAPSLGVSSIRGNLAAELEAPVKVRISVRSVVVALALLAVPLAPGALADPVKSNKAKPHAVFRPIPVEWDISAFEKPPLLPWDIKRPDAKLPLAGSNPAPTRKIAAPNTDALAVPGLTDQIPLGSSNFRFDAGRNYDDAASAVTDIGTSADAPNFRSLLRNGDSPSFSLPYIGFSLTTPTDALAER
jgi:hypothetical protein